MSSARTLIEGSIRKAVADAAATPYLKIDNGDVSGVTDRVVKEVGPTIEHLANAEAWWRSRVMIGSIGTIVTSVFGLYGLFAAGVTDGELYAAPIAASIGAGFAIYGRLIARKPLGR